MRVKNFHNLAANEKLDKRSKNLRHLILRSLKNSNKGHCGSSFSMLEIIRVLYDSIMKFDSKNPALEERDRLVVGPGWAALALYSVLADKGFFKINELDKYVDNNALLGGCIETRVPGVEATTGACGHGLPISVGIAMAQKIKESKSRVFSIVGDGEQGEGSIWEAAISASKNKLNNLCVIIDFNKIQCSGFFHDVSGFNDLVNKWESFGFVVKQVNGHNINDLQRAFSAFPYSKIKPSVIICHTIMSKGIPFAENNPYWHWVGKINDDRLEKMEAAIKGYQE